MKAKISKECLGCTGNQGYWELGKQLRIVSTYPLHNILKSLLGEGWYFRLCIRVSSLFRGAASKWQGILQLSQDGVQNVGNATTILCELVIPMFEVAIDL